MLRPGKHCKSYGVIFPEVEKLSRRPASFFPRLSLGVCSSIGAVGGIRGGLGLNCPSTGYPV